MNISVLQLAKMALDAAERAQKTADDHQERLVATEAALKLLIEEVRVLSSKLEHDPNKLFRPPTASRGSR